MRNFGWYYIDDAAASHTSLKSKLVYTYLSLYYLHISDYLDVFDSLDSVRFKSENQKHRSNLQELVITILHDIIII